MAAAAAKQGVAAKSNFPMGVAGTGSNFPA